MEALVIFSTAFVILLGIFGTMAAVDRYDDGHWWWDKPSDDKWLEAQAQAMRIQQLEHDVGMMPHSDREMAHLCRTCARAEEMALKQEEIVAKSWEVRPWDGSWRPAGVGRNLYPEVISWADDQLRQAAGIPPPLIGGFGGAGVGYDQVEITTLGDVEARYIDGMPHIIPDPPFPVCPPGRIKK